MQITVFDLPGGEVRSTTSCSAMAIAEGASRITTWEAPFRNATSVLDPGRKGTLERETNPAKGRQTRGPDPTDRFRSQGKVRGEPWTWRNTFT
eukprot:scaffold2859_cov349-Pavlova_lutheri.AAC.16